MILILGIVMPTELVGIGTVPISWLKTGTLISDSIIILKLAGLTEIGMYWLLTQMVPI